MPIRCPTKSFNFSRKSDNVRLKALILVGHRTGIFRVKSVECPKDFKFY